MIFAQPRPGDVGLNSSADPPVFSPRFTTAQKIIDQALGLLGLRDPSQPTDDNDAASCLDRLNTMIDGMRTQSMFAYATQLVTGTVQGSAKSITIGPSGNIPTAYRPIRIEDGSYFSTGGMDYYIEAITNVQYSQIAYKTLGTLGPDGAYYEPTLPNGTLYLYPQPNGAVTVSLQCLMQIVEFVDLSTPYNLAPGYERMIVYSLAEEIGPDYQKELTPMAARSAALARRNVRRANHDTPALNVYGPRGNIIIGWET